MTEKQAPLRGDFQWLGMSGAFDPTVEGASSARGYFGLVPEATYPWGTFRDANGKVYIFMRRLPFHGLTEVPKMGEARSTIGRRAVLFTQDDANELGVHPASMATGLKVRASSIGIRRRPALSPLHPRPRPPVAASAAAVWPPAD